MSRLFKLVVALVVVALASGFRATMKMVRFQGKRSTKNAGDIVVAIVFGLHCLQKNVYFDSILEWGYMLEKYCVIVFDRT